MKNARTPDPLEETLENPDLPPLATQAPRALSAARARRSLRVPIVVGALVLLLAAFGLRLVA